MLPERVSNPGPQTYESGALPIALRSPASTLVQCCEHTGLGIKLNSATGAYKHNKNIFYIA